MAKCFRFQPRDTYPSARLFSSDSVRNSLSEDAFFSFSLLSLPPIATFGRDPCLDPDKTVRGTLGGQFRNTLHTISRGFPPLLTAIQSPRGEKGGEWLRTKGREVRSRNHSIFSSSAPGTSVKKWRINHCQFFLGGSFRPSQHVSPQDLMRNDLRITRRGNTTNRPSRRPFLTSVVMPICLRIGAVMGLGPVGCRWVG